MTHRRIESPSNPRIRHLASLRDRTSRDQDGLYLVEGLKTLSRAVAAGHQPREMFLTEEHWEQWKDAAPATFLVSPKALDRASYRDRADGIIAVFDQFPTGLDAFRPKRPPLLCVVLDGSEKPGNLGAILRTCDAAGVSGVIVVDPSFDLFNPNVVRSSTGTLWTVPIAVSDRDGALNWLQTNSLPIVVASPSADTDFWSSSALTAPTALVIGGEAAGVSKEFEAAADETVSIPMHGTADSLNASVTAALMVYEVVRRLDPTA